MNTTTSTTKTYTVTPALFELNKFEVKVKTVNQNGTMISGDYLRNRNGVIRIFSSRNGARKAITRHLRMIAGEPGALHR